MDDNHRLEEWLAYHYYIMKLRYVVINIDPFSRTSPQAIVDRWNDIDTDTNTNRNDNSLHLKLNMTIVTMTDREYLPNYQERMQILETERLSTASDQDYQYGKVKTEYHRYRQRRFYHACSQHLMEHNKSWYVQRYTRILFVFFLLLLFLNHVLLFVIVIVQIIIKDVVL